MSDKEMSDKLTEGHLNYLKSTVNAMKMMNGGMLGAQFNILRVLIKEYFDEQREGNFETNPEAQKDYKKRILHEISELEKSLKDIIYFFSQKE